VIWAHNAPLPRFAAAAPIDRCANTGGAVGDCPRQPNAHWRTEPDYQSWSVFAGAIVVRGSAYGQSDLNCLLESAGGPAARQILILKPAYRNSAPARPSIGTLHHRDRVTPCGTSGARFPTTPSRSVSGNTVLSVSARRS
jgi:hypothetical protein